MVKILHIGPGICAPVQGFAESLQHDSSNQSEIVMIKLYCCGPGYCSRYPLLYYFFQIRNGLGSSVFKLCCKDSVPPDTHSLPCAPPDTHCLPSAPPDIHALLASCTSRYLQFPPAPPDTYSFLLHLQIPTVSSCTSRYLQFPPAPPDTHCLPPAPPCLLHPQVLLASFTSRYCLPPAPPDTPGVRIRSLDLS